MSSWIGFSVLWMLTGSPVRAGLVLLAAWLITDWYTFGFLRGVGEAVANLGRGRRLGRVLAVNPHDRTSRAQLGEILVGQRRFQAALETLTPLVQADPHDLTALWLLGRACLGAGRIEQGELFLGEVHGADPGFRGGTALLELGRARLARKDVSAEAPLGRYVAAHPHDVQGRVLHAAALRLSGDAAAAAAERARAWQEYETSLPYQRRAWRLWAWRARPSRPALYAAVLCGGLTLVGLAAATAPAARSSVDVRSSAIGR